jgi:hypothetical protein
MNPLSALSVNGKSPSPAMVRQTLEKLASEIANEHNLAIRAASEAVVHAINAGKMLLEVKASLEHGEFGAWIAANCPFSARTASDYMRVSKTAELCHFDQPPRSIASALRMLTDDSHPGDDASDSDEEPDHRDRDSDRDSDRDGDPLPGQMSLFGYTDDTDEEDDEPEEIREPTAEEMVNMGVAPPKVWLAFIDRLNSHACLINNHGGIAECTRDWSDDELPFVTENLKRFRDTFSQWISQLERRRH